jgi:hypothetical protein
MIAPLYANNGTYILNNDVEVLLKDLSFLLHAKTHTYNGRLYAKRQA